jgi:hypothetical protein
MFSCLKQTEQRIKTEKGKDWKFKSVGAEEIEKRVIGKWVSILEMERMQTTIYDYL